MGVFGLVNGQWKFFPNVAAAQAAGAVDISRQTNPSAQKMGPPDPSMYWDEMTGQWRFPQPDGSTPGAMPTIGIPGDGGGGYPPPIGTRPPPGIAPDTPPKVGPPQYGPPTFGPRPPFDGPPTYNPRPPYGPPTPPIGIRPPPTMTWGDPFEEYVNKYPDLAAAYKKHKSVGGKGDAKSWGKLHWERFGQKEKRSVPTQGGAPASEAVSEQTPNWDKYLSRNPDLTKAFGTNVSKAKQHWEKFGSKEKRQFTPYA